MTGVVVDTNVVFAYIYEKDPFHDKAAEIIDNAEEMYLPSPVIFELAFLLRRENIDLRVIRTLLSSTEIRFVEIELGDILFALNKQPKSYDEFNDYLILSTALRLRADLATFDEELRKIYENIISE